MDVGMRVRVCVTECFGELITVPSFISAAAAEGGVDNYR